MSKVSNISKSFYNLSVSKWPVHYNLINNRPCHLYKPRPVSKNHLRQSEFRNTVIASHQELSTVIPCGIFTNFLKILNFKNSSTNITVRHFTQSKQTLCNAKEKSDTVDESVEDNNVDKEQSSKSEIEKELTEKIESLAKEVSEYKDKYQRSLADRENLRQRLEKQIQESKQFGIQSFCKDLLEVTDVFRKAIESVPEEKKKEADPVFSSLYDGVVMTETHLISVFRRHGLKQIELKEGEKFDPSVQEAMFEVPVTDGKLPGTVAHVIRPGWKLHERCVRSAQVGVVKD
ncbi:UNVERIFIED_CONTAM: hypothetical protein RMT77_017194 [Armadillidium vulgare]